LANSPNCLLARLSGSGPTCFGLFTTRTQAQNAATAISQHHPRWWVVPAPLLGANFDPVPQAGETPQPT